MAVFFSPCSSSRDLRVHTEPEVMSDVIPELSEVFIERVLLAVVKLAQVELRCSSTSYQLTNCPNRDRCPGSWEARGVHPPNLPECRLEGQSCGR